MLYSSDATTWYKGTLALNGCNQIVSTPNQLVAAGGPYQTTFSIATSVDGINWTGIANSSTIFGLIYTIAYNNFIYVVGTAGQFSLSTLGYSYDGINWTAVSNSRTIFTMCNSITWNGTYFFAIGVGTYTLAYSLDGVNWIGVTNNLITNTVASNSIYIASRNKINDLITTTPPGLNSYFGYANPADNTFISGTNYCKFNNVVTPPGSGFIGTTGYIAVPLSGYYNITSLNGVIIQGNGTVTVSLIKTNPTGTVTTINNISYVYSVPSGYASGNNFSVNRTINTLALLNANDRISLLFTLSGTFAFISPIDQINIYIQRLY